MYPARRAIAKGELQREDFHVAAGRAVGKTLTANQTARKGRPATQPASEGAGSPWRPAAGILELINPVSTTIQTKFHN